MRRSRTVLGIFILVVGAGVVGTLLQDPIYRATALLEIRTPAAGLAPTDALSSSERISAEVMGTERGLLQSPALARRVVTDLELHRMPQFRGSDPAEITGEPGGDAREPSEAELQVAMGRFLGRLVVHPEPDSRLVRVSFDFPDPEVAAQIVNGTLSNYTAMRMDAARRAVDWLGVQLDSLRTELEASEERLRAYAEQHDLPYVVEEDLAPRVRDRVRRLEEDLADAEARRYEAESLLNLVVRGGDFEAAEDRVVEQLSVRLSELRREYAGLSSTFTDEYPAAQQVRRQIEEIERLMDEERGRIARSIESQHELALRQEEALRNALAGERASADALMQQSGPYHLLRGEVLANRELYASLQQRRGETHVSSALEAAGIGAVDYASPPLGPHRPVLAHNLALAILAGLVLGIGGAFLREFMDDTVRTGNELVLGVDVPILALIPSAPVAESRGRRKKGGRLGGSWPRIDRLLKRGDDDQMLVEAMSILRTAVLFGQDADPPRSLLVSSCQPDEGKTTVGLNLALSLRRLGRRVLLVDADMRRSGLSRAADMRSGAGLAEHLRRGVDWRELVREDEDDAGLHVLPSGAPAQDAAELVSHPRMRTLIREAEEEYDLVIVDAPALFVNAPDAHMIAEAVSGVLLVARSERTSSMLLNQVIEATPNVLGVVVNDLDVSRLPPQYRQYFTPYGQVSHRGTPADRGNGNGRPAGRAPHSERTSMSNRHPGSAEVSNAKLVSSGQPRDAGTRKR